MIGKAVLGVAALVGACCAADAQRSRSVPAAPVVSDFGACAARRLPDQGRALLATPLDSRAEQRAARRMAESRSACVAARFNSISMRTGEFRGGVAEGLIEADPTAMARLRALPQQPPVRAEARQGRAFVAAYARCLADADPARAAGLLELVAASREERAAFLGFGALLEECMPIGLLRGRHVRRAQSHRAPPLRARLSRRDTGSGLAFSEPVRARRGAPPPCDP